MMRSGDHAVEVWSPHVKWFNLNPDQCEGARVGLCACILWEIIRIKRDYSGDAGGGCFIDRYIQA